MLQAFFLKVVHFRDIQYSISSNTHKDTLYVYTNTYIHWHKHTTVYTHTCVCVLLTLIHQNGALVCFLKCYFTQKWKLLPQLLLRFVSSVWNNYIRGNTSAGGRALNEQNIYWHKRQVVFLFYVRTTVFLIIL